ncbi:MAG: hypothetical protein AAFV95_10625 [Bacteroidota bacterium]
MEWSLKIRQHRFEEKIQYTKAIALGHLILGLIILTVGSWAIHFCPILACAATVFLFVTAILMDAWKSQAFNWGVLALYVGTLVLELLYGGLPAYFLDYQGGGSGIGHGIIMEFLILAFPYIYLFIRIGLLIPLIQLILARRQL